MHQAQSNHGQLDKLTVAQLFDKFLVFYYSLHNSHQLDPILSHINPVKTFIYISLRSILILSSHLQASSPCVSEHNLYAFLISHIRPPSSSSLYNLKLTSRTSYWLSNWHTLYILPTPLICFSHPFSWPCHFTSYFESNPFSNPHLQTPKIIINCKPRLTAVGIRCADHATPSTPKSWHELRRQAAVARYS
jgi:hypothetical protein